MRRAAATMALAGILGLGLVACDPAPHTTLTVDSTAVGADGDPGDGICSSPAAGGACTLQAAIDEAASLGATVIDVPAGTYQGDATTRSLAVVGDLVIDGAGVDATLLDTYGFSVASGSRLELKEVRITDDRVGTPIIDVDGAVALQRSAIIGLNEGIDVAEGASLVSWSSVLVSQAPITNQGAVLVQQSTVTLLHSRWGASFRAGDAHWTASATVGEAIGPASFGVSCTAQLPTSHGYNRTAFGGCGLSSTGDSTGLALTEFEGSGLGRTPAASSPLVDAIPIGAMGCETTTVDLYGNPRGVDGNGDGIPGCDIGAVERQP